MARSNTTKNLHLDLLKEYNVELCPEGQVKVIGNDYSRVCLDQKVILGYHDDIEKPWREDYYFSGPVWFWLDELKHWEYKRDGISFIGEYGLYAHVVNIKLKKVYVTECFAEPY